MKIVQKIKFSVVLITLFSFSNVFSQETPSKMPIDENTGKITYKEVVQEEGSRNELFNRAIEWINKEYKNPVAVTRVRNPATGTIDIVHRIDLTFDNKGVAESAGYVEYFFKIELKEGRYRYIVTDFTKREVSRMPIEKWLDTSATDYSPQMANYLNQIDKFTKELTNSLKEGMKPAVKKVIEDW